MSAKFDGLVDGPLSYPKVHQPNVRWSADGGNADWLTNVCNPSCNVMSSQRASVDTPEIGRVLMANREPSSSVTRVIKVGGRG